MPNRQFENTSKFSTIDNGAARVWATLPQPYVLKILTNTCQWQDRAIARDSMEADQYREDGQFPLETIGEQENDLQH